MSRLMGILALVGAVVSVGCARGESYVKAGADFGRIEKVAVVRVEGRVGSQAAANEIADYVGMEFMKRGYGVIERTQIDAVLKEQEFQGSAVTSNEDAVRVGRVLNVPAVVVVNIPEADERISMTAKMIDVQTGEMLWMGEGTGSTGRTLSTVGGAVVGGALGASLGSGRTAHVVGGVAGAVAGGVAGHTLSPDESRQVRKVIARVCEALPSRLPTAYR
jgi:uncharacterized protein YcfJ